MMPGEDASTRTATTAAAAARCCAGGACRRGGAGPSGSSGSGSGSGRIFRCAGCRSARYCGRECQLADWGRHRRYCRAAAELGEILRRTSPRQAERQYHAANDAADELAAAAAARRSQEASALGNVPQPPRTRQLPRAAPARSRPSSKKSTLSRTDKESNSPASAPRKDEGAAGPRPAPRRPFDPPPPRASPDRSKAPAPSRCRFRIRHMPNLSCYQLQLLAGGGDEGNERADCELEFQSLESRLEPTDRDGSTICTFATKDRATLLSLRLPGKVVGAALYGPAPGGCLRLSYEPLSADVQATRKPELAASDLSSARCRPCGQPLLSEASPRVDRVLPLPSGRWHEMTDYLVCYPGQPAIDLGSSSLVAPAAADPLPSASASPSPSQTALEDETTVVLQDLEASGTVAVLAVPGYGEDPRDDSDPWDPEGPGASAARRGGRPWRDWVGGATLTCSACASVLGFATAADGASGAGTAPAPSPSAARPSAWASRLLKHRIGWTSSAGGGSGGGEFGVVDFVMREMIRYSENKAIFSFRVACEGRGGRLLLRILSWDSEAGTDREGRAAPGADGSLEVQWRRLVQVLYEESHADDGGAPLQAELQWTWNRDWCCAPIAKEEKSDEAPIELPASVVRLFLELEEYEELRRGLRQASDWYSEDAKQATILSTIGRPSAKVGLAAILL